MNGDPEKISTNEELLSMNGLSIHEKACIMEIQASVEQNNCYEKIYLFGKQDAGTLIVDLRFPFF